MRDRAAAGLRALGHVVFWALRLVAGGVFGVAGYWLITTGGQLHGPTLFGLVVGILFIALAVHAVFGKRN